jgi:two-component system sensor histidine kinase CpxA
MRGLFLRIFAAFFIAQSLIFVITTSLILREHFPVGGQIFDALDVNLLHDASIAIRAYEGGGCPAFSNNGERSEPSGAALLTEDGRTVCTTATARTISNLPSHFRDRVDGHWTNSGFVWLVPVTAKDGTRYEYAWFQPPSIHHPPPRISQLLHFAFPQLWVAIAVGAATTFILALLFTRPIVRLRTAARSLASGNLSARVETSGPLTSPSQSNEFQGLVHDFNHMAERLESLVGAQRLLLRDVSHELRSPLARLSVALELAHDDATPGLDPHLARIEREAEKLNQLIGQLLTLSSLEARENVESFQPVSLNELCTQILPDAEYEARQRSCSVTLEQTSECTIRGDWELLYRAVENVVRNAIRYTNPETEVTIRIAEVTLRGARMASIEVSDRGPGIPEAELAHIFRPFYRVDSARSSSTGGFGVGLAITERAVRLHQGTLSATNRPGGGTTITFLIPEGSA